MDLVPAESAVHLSLFFFFFHLKLNFINPYRINPHPTSVHGSRYKPTLSTPRRTTYIVCMPGPLLLLYTELGNGRERTRNGVARGKWKQFLQAFKSFLYKAKTSFFFFFRYIGGVLRSAGWRGKEWIFLFFHSPPTVPRRQFPLITRVHRVSQRAPLITMIETVFFFFFAVSLPPRPPPCPTSSSRQLSANALARFYCQKRSDGHLLNFGSGMQSRKKKCIKV